MASNNKVLTIDITNESITITEVTASEKKTSTVHNAIIFETPEDAYEDGFIRDKERIAEAIKSQLAANGITNKNAIFVLTSTKIVNREVLVPFVKENKIKGIINANSSEYFPVNIEDYTVSHSVLETVTDEENNKQLRVLAVAAPTSMVRSYYEVAALAGLKVVALDYIGNAMLQLIKTQTSENMTTMVIQLGSESTVLNIVKGDILLLQRTVPYGTNVVVNEVMDAKGVDATTAMTLLQNERLITVDFDDNAITGSFRYLINNIGRVMDFFASKNPDKPIDDVFLTGDGALIKGIDGLFKVQLNVSTRVMDSLFNIKFDPKIDLKIYNPVYLMVPIGAAFAPMGFTISEGGASGKKEGQMDTTPLVVAFLILAVLVAGGLTAVSFVLKNQAQTELDDVNKKIASIQDIETIVKDYENAESVYVDAMSMYSYTKNLNENVVTFITALEEKMPKGTDITAFESDSTGVSISGTATEYDDIAGLAISLKEIDCIDNSFIGSITENVDEDTGKITYDFTVTCIYVDASAADADTTETDATLAE
ncbi:MULTISPECIES: type IV pilus assembly protein PilM [Clostridia]|jgi:type IV pilus assembly protein PilN|uniref:Type IV pilus assembly protein PilM n=2 Tax=Coprococcus TaxID=33042 RepID=A0A8I0APL0_9FIRM|nr:MULTISPECIES: type IV pilus assembly protein PilM [Clostridia]RHV82208.1 type IV pilus assembly protein PilM [Clostridium sp. OF10-22XD]SCH89028.1 type IV pilus assembly protein PilM [uncultured Coprococcus sp.]MBC5662827.1 type IV pilus assembly protein PilM [Coprococcus hominis (ex Liu et al. 2022)]MCB5503203.1 type IV pilus assembly protein PilM [Coprococcus eutactus]MCU6730994.1 type IV pilus assembly protein PilM [Coprococcus ammoniilyticus]